MLIYHPCICVIIDFNRLSLFRKTSASPPVQGAQSAAQSGTQRDGWPSLPPGSSAVNPSSLSTSGIAKPIA